MRRPHRASHPPPLRRVADPRIWSLALYQAKYRAVASDGHGLAGRIRVRIAAGGALGLGLDAADLGPRADDAERPGGLVPVGEHGPSTYRPGQLQMPLEQGPQPLARDVVERERLDELSVEPDRQPLVRVVHEKLAAGHACGEVAPEVAEDDDDPARHVLAGVRAGALDDGGCARVAHRQPLARRTGAEELARRGAVQ